MERDPRFLQLFEVLRIHQSLIETYGGDDGIRDVALLQSAIAQPSVSYDGRYLHTDLFEMASAYLFHIVQNHPFLDGNKRTGAASAIVFLNLNDIELSPDEAGLVEITVRTACGAASKSEVAQFLRRIAT